MQFLRSNVMRIREYKDLEIHNEVDKQLKKAKLQVWIKILT
jgi:hypothetical protein